MLAFPEHSLKNNCPTVPHQSSSSQSKPLINKDKQYKLIKSFQKRFQNRKEQVNEITAASEDDSSDDQTNQFFSEFEKLMCEDAKDYMASNQTQLSSMKFS